MNKYLVPILPVTIILLWAICSVAAHGQEAPVIDVSSQETVECTFCTSVVSLRATSTEAPSIDQEAKPTKQARPTKSAPINTPTRLVLATAVSTDTPIAQGVDSTPTPTPTTVPIADSTTVPNIPPAPPVPGLTPVPLYPIFADRTPTGQGKHPASKDYFQGNVTCIGVDPEEPYPCSNVLDNNDNTFWQAPDSGGRMTIYMPTPSAGHRYPHIDYFRILFTYDPGECEAYVNIPQWYSLEGIRVDNTHDLFGERDPYHFGAENVGFCGEEWVHVPSGINTSLDNRYLLKVGESMGGGNTSVFSIEAYEYPCTGTADNPCQAAAIPTVGNDVVGGMVGASVVFLLGFLFTQLPGKIIGGGALLAAIALALMTGGTQWLIGQTVLQAGIAVVSLFTTLGRGQG